jgi:hypothetical protein
MQNLLAYILVITLSSIVSRWSGLIVSMPISFALIWTSVQIRSAISGFICGIVYYIAPVAFGWLVFSWIVGEESFTFLPFLLSVLRLIITIPRNFRQTQTESKMKADLKNKGSSFLAQQMGSTWSRFIGEVTGLILATIWFFFIR